MNPVLSRRAQRKRPVSSPSRRRNFAGTRLSPRHRSGRALALAAVVLAALVVVHVRVRVIEEGYLRVAAIERVETLLEQRQRLKADIGALKNHERLTALAAELGFQRPQHEIWLAPPGGMNP